MRSQSADTDAEAEAVQVKLYREMSPRERLKRVEAANRAVREMACARLREKYGDDLDDREKFLRLASLRLDRETMIAVYGWDPEEEGY